MAELPALPPVAPPPPPPVASPSPATPAPAVIPNGTLGRVYARPPLTKAEEEEERRKKTLEKLKADVGYERLEVVSDVSKISIIGVGMKSHTGVAEKMFTALSEKGINIDVISTSEIKISVLIAAPYTELAVRALHTAFGLDSE